MNGKGDAPRPMGISREEYNERWDLAMNTAVCIRCQKPLLTAWSVERRGRVCWQCRRWENE